VSAHPDTRSQPTLRAGVDVPTLLITAIASATAAYVTSKVWQPGTLASAALTPVIVALVKEALARPTEAVTRAVPIRGVVRSAPAPRQAGEPPAEPAPPPTARVPQPGVVTPHRVSRGARRWRLAIVTGLLGFVIAALALTVPELVAGQSAGGGGRSTTLFGGDDRDERRDERRERRREREPARTVTVQTRTVIVPSRTTTVPPAATTTAPATTTTPTPTTTTTTQPPG
jgi:hypothetical protein